MIYNTDTTIQQATIDLLMATLRSIQPGTDEATLEQWFHNNAAVLGFADIAGADLLHKLGALLAFLENQPSSTSLNSAVHSTILALTQKKRFEEAVEHESRRQIYNFVYGLTHEINNPLANIAARAQQLMAACRDAEAEKSLATIIDQSMRAHEMLAESMNAVRPPKVECELVDISKILVASVERFRKKHDPKELDFFMHPLPANLFSMAAPGLLEESIESLLLNAVEACRPGDRIDLIAELLESGDPDEAGLSTVNRQIRIAIRDTGRGINSSDLKQVWDLYYSGRESGRGLGISLAKAKRVVEGLGGKIWLVSNPNAGTTVEIRLASASAPVPGKRRLSL